MTAGISTVRRTSQAASCFQDNDVDFVIRYYSETTQIPTKVITRLEAEALSQQGIRIGVVYQDRQNRSSDFSLAAGLRDGHYAFAYAQSLGQPLKTGIFFAVDYDASEADLNGQISAYFRGVSQAFVAASQGQDCYRIGVYGSGLTCRLLKSADLVELTWLAQSSGWRQSRDYQDWDCKQGFGHGALCGLASWQPCQTSGATDWLFSLPADSPVVAAAALPVLSNGAVGEDVRRLQAWLNKWLLTEGAQLLIIDGDFGNRVYRAVKAFQAKNVDNFGLPLVVDGVVGGLTWGALQRFAQNQQPPLVTPATLNAAGQLDSSWSKTMPDTAFGGTSRGRAALQQAIDELNDDAREIGGNNRGPFVRKYLNGLVEEGNNWCAAFVSWCCQQSGQMPFNYSVGARDIRNQLARQGLTYNDPMAETPQPGDLVIWWRGAPSGWMGHIGFVHHVSHGRIFTIEGNRTSHVQGFSYPVASMERLLGFARLG